MHLLENFESVDDIYAAEYDAYVAAGVSERLSEDLADKQSCIIIGRCADSILKNNEKVIRLFFYADESSCIKNVMDMYAFNEKEARERIEAIDRSRAAYYKYYTGKDWNDVNNYDLCINTGRLGFETSPT